MLDIGSTELLLIIIVAIVVIGPKDLPRALYKVGQVVGKAKGVMRHFRTGVDAMVREVELEEMEKKWKADNERIMREHANAPAMQPLPAPATASRSAPAATDTAPVTASPSPDAASPATLPPAPASHEGER
ncbi:Sec-independent protein translocase protein TatB [Blastomonas sp.]|uniref:Sec-independent protein translocase protein TatB n=1 Tax=Blastomonas sp. TaxID=1909299 RepID=UPI003593A123